MGTTFKELCDGVALGLPVFLVDRRVALRVARKTGKRFMVRYSQKQRRQWFLFPFKGVV